MTPRSADRHCVWVARLPWLLLFVFACGEDATSPNASAPDGGGAQAGNFVRGRGQGELFDPCDSASDCVDGYACDHEINLAYKAQNLPPGSEEIATALFPNGVCTPMQAAQYDPSGETSCVPDVPRDEQGCGDDGECVPVGSGNAVLVACRPSCDPSAEAPCGGRFGYTCDFDERVCVEGCQSDDECRIVLVDEDGDDKPDALAYDEASEASCDAKTFRCVHEHASDSHAGAACARLDDCDPEGVCIDPLQTFAGFHFPDGYCTKSGCEEEGRECGQGEVCQRLRPLDSGLVTTPICLQRCEVGAEAEGDRVGPEGHGEGCRPGYACHYNGGAGTEGVCVGGNYNATTSNNIGAPCRQDQECFSPFGLGSCLSLSAGQTEAPTGICSVLDCAVPGLPEDVCGSNNQCIGLPDSDLTFCVRSCSKAGECPAGFACADDDGSPATEKICYPACFGPSDCRPGQESCELDPNTGFGVCVASGP